MVEHDAEKVQRLHEILALDPFDGASWSALGIASLRTQDTAAARIQFARATVLLPEEVIPWQGLGWSCLLLHDLSAALAAFQRALVLAPESAEAHGSVGLALRLAGRDDEAEPHLATAGRLDPRNVSGHYARSLAPGFVRDGTALRGLALRLLAPRLPSPAMRPPDPAA